MTYVVTGLCKRTGECQEVCPVECIVVPPSHTPWRRAFIDPYTCIDCHECAEVCPEGAIFPSDKVPVSYSLGADAVYTPMEGAPVQGEGKQVNLQEAIPETYRFFDEGPGYAVDG
ncbi:MAG: hypothetical protein KatS3mg033_1597 [Thermonema sp.]|uniref:indolepyruvate ferredoxin oxidoreductase subunit alpha n=1 Tax=Thermonema sp. TaxID=2231181 RepID=UPI0021DE6709|nr:4Fe-4S binding protein [Thermonema sp.]GIV39797.1 MAG: hypothetical protein KatS3mg033_1597 [Thermonema sp.]